MLKLVQHDKKKYVIPNLFRNLEFGNDNELNPSVLVVSSRRVINSARCSPNPVSDEPIIGHEVNLVPHLNVCYIFSLLTQWLIENMGRARVIENQYLIW